MSQPSDCTLLREPTRRAFLDALASMGARAGVSRARDARVEVLIYFSGHADEQGLMLGRELLPYTELRAAIGSIGADVGITILDACASGAITRIKGGRSHPAFLAEGAANVSGYAFLTSSSENEAAQEAEYLQGSFFTHALLTGLRGAADVSDDGRVTLGEAYQFAFNETLAETTPTQAGAQHPAYDIKLAGTGDVVMTDVRETAASLILGAGYDGRFLVLDGRRRLAAELYKPPDRRVELGLEPGRYEVFFEQEHALLAARIALADGDRHELSRDELEPRQRLPTNVRSPGLAGPVPGSDLDGRWRVALLAGLTSVNSVGSDNVSVEGATLATTASRWARKDLAVDFWLIGVGDESTSTSFGTRFEGGWGILLGARYYPPLRGALRPYLGGAIGPWTDTFVRTAGDTTEVHVDSTKIGGLLGGGADFLIGSHFTLTVDGHVTLRDGHSRLFNVLFGLGWRFGGGPRQQ